MASFATIYDKQETRGSLKVAKAFSAAPSDIKIIPGFNVREIDDDHVATFAQAYADKQPVPPILVATAEDGSLELVDGEHRLRGAIIAGIPLIQMVEFKGDAEQRVAAAVRHNQGKQMTATEKARAYLRMQKFGWSNARIAAESGVSEGTVANHLLLAASGNDVLTMIEKDEVKPTTVMNLARSVGPHLVHEKLLEAAETIAAKAAQAPTKDGTKAAPDTRTRKQRIKDKDVKRRQEATEKAWDERENGNKAKFILKTILPHLTELQLTKESEDQMALAPATLLMHLTAPAGAVRALETLREMITAYLESEAKNGR